MNMAEWKVFVWTAPRSLGQAFSRALESRDQSRVSVACVLACSFVVDVRVHTRRIIETNVSG